MKTKKSKKDQSESSSGSDSTSASDSSSESSPEQKKSKKLQKERKDSPQPDEKSKENEKLKSRDKKASTSTKDRRDAEHSKWDSPSEKRRSRENVRRSPMARREDKEKGRGHDQGDSKQEKDRERREDDRRSNQRSHDDDQRNRSNEKYKEKRDDHRGHSGTRYDDRKRHDHDRYDDRNDRNDRRDRGGGYRRNDNRDRSPRRDNSRQRNRRSRSRSFDHRNATWGRADDNASKNDRKSQQDKQKPNFALSGKLAEETNTFKGVVIKYSEPPEARKPKRRWRLYPFKGEKAMQVLYIHRESAYLIGRDRKVVDLPIDHPSCSKQHAALQYRLVPFTRENGSAGKRVRPYVIDLESANGTFLNQQKIESKKYVELFEKDVLKFGFSSREYVLLHENSKDEAQDDDVKVEEEEAPIKPEVKEDEN